MKLKNFIFAALFMLAFSFAKADSLVVMLDISSSTPIVEPNFMRTAIPIVGNNIIKLPVGSSIQILTVGDDKQKPLNLQFYVQRIKDRSGDTAANLAKSVPAMIAGYLNEVRSNPSKMQGESSLSPAFLDASKWFQSGKPSTVIFYSDGMEYQPNVIAYPRDYKKSLPPIASLDLKGANVLIYGIGQCAAGQETSCATSQQRIAIEQHWTKWLKDHKAGEVDLRRL